MKKTFRLTIIIISIGIVVTAIGLWRHHYLKIMNAEPERVYKDTPVQDNLPKNTIVQQKKADKSTPSEPETFPKDTSVNSDDDTDIESEPQVAAQPIDNSITPEETDNKADLTVHHIFSDIIVENLPPKAAEALKEYEKIELELPVLNEELKPLMEARPVDWDAIKAKINEGKLLKERRKDALEILSKHSKEALAELQKTIRREKAAEIVVEETAEDPDMDAEDAIRRLEELTE